MYNLNRLFNTNNDAEAAGQVITEYEYDHTVLGEAFYQVKLRIQRLSSRYDEIPLLIPERIIDSNSSPVGKYILVRGEFRSINRVVDQENRLLLRLFVKEMEEYTGNMQDFPNHIRLDGYLCKEPVYRTTPTGREITDIMVAVHRGYGKTDYIPCILWGRNARYVRRFPMGTRMRLDGRLQSRIYRKRISPEDYVTRETYEISVNSMEWIPETEEVLHVAESSEVRYTGNGENYED